MTDKKRRPSSITDALSSFLEQSGLKERVAANNAVDAWAGVAGPQIAKVTEARSVTVDGTLFIYVKTNAWMNELSLMAPDLIKRLNDSLGSEAVKRLRFQLMRDE